MIKDSEESLKKLIEFWDNKEIDEVLDDMIPTNKNTEYVDNSDTHSFSSDSSSYTYKYTPDDLYNACKALLKELHSEYYLDSELVDYDEDDGASQINIVFDNETKSARMYLNDKYGFVFNYGLSYVAFDEVTWDVIEKVYKMLDN